MKPVFNSRYIFFSSTFCISYTFIYLVLPYQ